MTTLRGGTGSDGAAAGIDSDGAANESDGAGGTTSRATIPAARPSQNRAARGDGDPISSRPLADNALLTSITNKHCASP